MAMRVDTLDEDLITCQICLYEFDEEIKKPKFLQCSHTICLECFQATRRQDTITCPFCRTVTSKYNRNGAEWILPTNQYVLKMIKMNRTEAISMPSTATVRKSVEEEADEQLIPAVAISAKDEEYNSNLIEVMESIHQSLLYQQQEKVLITAAATAQPANEDEQLRLALDMSGKEMERKALNGAMHQSISNQQQRVRRSRDRRNRRDRRSVNRHGESQRNAVAATPAIQPIPEPNSTIDKLSIVEIMLSLLFFYLRSFLWVLYYAFLLIRQYHEELLIVICYLFILFFFCGGFRLNS